MKKNTDSMALWARKVLKEERVRHERRAQETRWEHDRVKDTLSRAIPLCELKRSRDTYELRACAESLRNLANALDAQAEQRDALKTLEFYAT